MKMTGRYTSKIKITFHLMKGVLNMVEILNRLTNEELLRLLKKEIKSMSLIPCIAVKEED